jgi:hypothetical protein
MICRFTVYGASFFIFVRTDKMINNIIDYINMYFVAISMMLCCDVFIASCTLYFELLKGCRNIVCPC